MSDLRARFECCSSAGALALFALLLWTAAPAASGQVAPPGLDTAFTQLQSDFDARAKASFGDEAVGDRGTFSVFLSRRHLGQVLAEAFNRAAVGVRISYPQTPIEVAPAEVKIGHQDEPDCNPDQWGCKSNCGWDLGCIAEKPVCEAGKAAKRGACELKKAAVNLISDKKLFTLSFHAIVVEGRATAGFTLGSDDGLSRLTVAAVNPTGSLTLDGGSVTFNPEVLTGVAFACAPFTVTVPGVTVSVSESRIATTATLKPQPSTNGLKLAVELSPVTASLHFEHHPILGIIGHNLHALLLCPVPWSIADLLGGVFDLAWDHTIPVSGTPGPLELTIGELKLQALAKPLVVNTRLNSLALELTGSFSTTPRVAQVAPAVQRGSIP